MNSNEKIESDQLKRLEQSLIEMKEMREGKLEKKNAREFLKEMKELFK